MLGMPHWGRPTNQILPCTRGSSFWCTHQSRFAHSGHISVQSLHPMVLSHKSLVLATGTTLLTVGVFGATGGSPPGGDKQCTQVEAKGKNLTSRSRYCPNHPLASSRISIFISSCCVNSQVGMLLFVVDLSTVM